MLESFDGWNLILKKMLKRKAFNAKPRHQYHVPNKDNVFKGLITERVKTIMRIHVCLILWMNFNSKAGKKLFMWNESIDIMYPMKKTCLRCPIIERLEIIIRIHVYLIWWSNFDSKKNHKRIVFLIKPKPQYHLSQWGKCVYGAQ